MNEEELKTYERLKGYILWLLGRRDYSQKELYTKSKQLMQKKDMFFSDEIFNAVMEKMHEYDYQSDERTTQSFVDSYYEKGKGIIYICAKLQEKGIDRQTTMDFLEQHAEDYDFFEKARTVRLRKFPNELDDYKDMQKCYRFLASRGFQPDEIKYALESVKT
jgi:regulatory protein